MTPQLSLDLHAHVNPAISGDELSDHRSVVFAVTRSLEEAASAVARSDQRTCWGVGCHPGLAWAHAAFDRDKFAALSSRSAFVSEIGLDGDSSVPLEIQCRTLDSILGVLTYAPRITSLHSYQASGEVLLALEKQPIKGAVLHWWLGDRAQTIRALELGCFFSINESSARRKDLLDLIPLERVLTETDHPFGDRQSGRDARPGAVAAVERALADFHGVTESEIRSTVWKNLALLADDADCVELLPRSIRIQLIAG